MTKYCFILFSMLFIVLIGSCRKDFEYAVSTGNLEFSRDTIYLDTVFSTLGSSTYGLKVYNRSNRDIQVPLIKLGKGASSAYRLNVDGIAGKEFQNVPLLARDSMYVFVEITLDITASGEREFIYTDAIEFHSSEHRQEVQLVTLVKDAIFLFPGKLNGAGETLTLGLDEAGNEIRIEGFDLEDEQLQFFSEKPYVIYGYAAVPEGKELTIAPGTRVYFHKDSGILVKARGSLKIRGEISADSVLLEKEVIFEGDRLEPAFERVPGQWGAIWLLPGSVEHEITHLTIKNATVGLLVEGTTLSSDAPTLAIANSRIYNSSLTNLWARAAKVHGENLVLGGAGNTSLYCNQGGDYTFLHCTIANYWTAGIRTGPALQIDNYSTDADSDQGNDLIKADFINCIIDGNRAQELFLNPMADYQFNFRFSHSLIKYRDTGSSSPPNPLYNFEDTNRYSSVLLNQDATFFDAGRNDFRIGVNSAAGGMADEATVFNVPLDILGQDRTATLDIGAFSIRF